MGQRTLVIAVGNQRLVDDWMIALCAAQQLVSPLSVLRGLCAVCRVCVLYAVCVCCVVCAVYYTGDNTNWR
jgi:hypothetical protein